MSPKIQVSIPVAIGGYTGQRDAWESFARDYAVTYENPNVTLEEVQGVIGRKITFDLDDLRRAITFLESQND